MDFKRLMSVIAVAMIMPAVPVWSAGMSPSDAIEIDLGETVEGSTSRAVFYRVVASADGLLVVTLEPSGADLDLAVTASSGSPTAESRSGAENPEEVILRASEGEAFIIRVTASGGREGEFTLQASIESGAGGGEGPPGAESGSSGAVSYAGDASSYLPLGLWVPIEADGEETFHVYAPAGLPLAVILRPVSGDLDLEVTGEDGSVSASSAREGTGEEEILIPVAEDGGYTITVVPAAGEEGPYRYYIGTELRTPGVSLVPNEPWGGGAPFQGGDWGRSWGGYYQGSGAFGYQGTPRGSAPGWAAPSYPYYPDRYYPNQYYPYGYPYMSGEER